MFYRNETDTKTAPRAPKLSYFDGRAPHLSAQVNHGTLAAGVIGQIQRHIVRLKTVESLHKCISYMGEIHTVTTNNIFVVISILKEKVL